MPHMAKAASIATEPEWQLNQDRVQSLVRTVDGTITQLAIQSRTSISAHHYPDCLV